MRLKADTHFFYPFTPSSLPPSLPPSLLPSFALVVEAINSVERGTFVVAAEEEEGLGVPGGGREGGREEG